MKNYKYIPSFYMKIHIKTQKIYIKTQKHSLFQGLRKCGVVELSFLTKMESGIRKKQNLQFMKKWNLQERQKHLAVECIFSSLVILNYPIN